MRISEIKSSFRCQEDIELEKTAIPQIQEVKQPTPTNNESELFKDIKAIMEKGNLLITL